MVKKSSFFDDEDTKIQQYESTKVSASKSNPVQDSPGKTGRPRTAQGRVVFTIKPRADVRKKIKALAVEHDCTASDIVDALVDQCIGNLDWDTVGKDS